MNTAIFDFFNMHRCIRTVIFGYAFFCSVCQLKPQFNNIYKNKPVKTKTPMLSLFSGSIVRSSNTLNLTKCLAHSFSINNNTSSSSSSRLDDPNFSSLPAQIQIDQELQRRQLELFAQHKALQTQLDSKLGDFFYKLYGTKDEYQPKTSYMASRLMGYYGVNPDVISTYLLKIFKGTLYAAAAKDKKFMDQYVEPDLAKKIAQDVKNTETKFKGKLRVFDDPMALGKVKDEVWTLEMALIRGLNIDRSKNKSLDEYTKYTQDDEMGLTIFTPKNLSQPEAFIDPKTNKTIYEDYSKQLVMRVFARIKTPLKLRVISPQIPPVDESVYTWQHLAIFENEMHPPKVITSSYKLETYLEWLSRFKFGCWKLADIDNCMRGNSLIRSGSQDMYTQDVFKGSKYDKSASIDVKDVDK